MAFWDTLAVLEDDRAGSRWRSEGRGRFDWRNFCERRFHRIYSVRDMSGIQTSSNETSWAFAGDKGISRQNRTSKPFGVIAAYPPELALSHLAPKTTLAIIKVPATMAVAIAVRATPSRAAPTKAHDEKGT
jgi:hypothetical protein